MLQRYFLNFKANDVLLEIAGSKKEAEPDGFDRETGSFTLTNK